MVRMHSVAIEGAKTIFVLNRSSEILRTKLDQSFVISARQMLFCIGFQSGSLPSATYRYLPAHWIHVGRHCFAIFCQPTIISQILSKMNYKLSFLLLTAFFPIGNGSKPAAAKAADGKDADTKPQILDHPAYGPPAELNPLVTETGGMNFTAHGFIRHHLHKRLLRPSVAEKELKEPSRRLKIAEQKVDMNLHRRLVPKNPVQSIENSKGVFPVVERFATGDWGNYDFRVKPDAPMKHLPPGLGAGVEAGIPKGTKGYWDGLDGEAGLARTPWEIVACPVIDPPGFLKNPVSANLC